jgi:hypothetical protein
VQLSGQSTFPVFPESDIQFFYEAVDAQLRLRAPATVFCLDRSARLGGEGLPMSCWGHV